jgi:AraC-like DNA-binding protein
MIRGSCRGAKSISLSRILARRLFTTQTTRARLVASRSHFSCTLPSRPRIRWSAGGRQVDPARLPSAQSRQNSEPRAIDEARWMPLRWKRSQTCRARCASRPLSSRRFAMWARVPPNSYQVSRIADERRAGVERRYLRERPNSRIGWCLLKRSVRRSEKLPRRRPRHWSRRAGEIVAGEDGAGAG